MPNSTFSEYGHVAYQIKGNDACSNMVANVNLFQNMVMLHIILRGITNAATCKYIFCPYTHPRPLGWGQRSKHFSESSLFAYQIKRNGT